MAFAFFKKFFQRKKPVNATSRQGPVFTQTQFADGTITFALADIEQTIGGVRQLRDTDIDEMVSRKDDLSYQLGLCERMMKDGDILPFPFLRTAILLRKEKKLAEELAICTYVKTWCKQAEKEYDGHSAMHWKSPTLRDCVSRIPKIEEQIKKLKQAG